MKDSYEYNSDELFKDDLRQAISHSIPDIFEDIYSVCINRHDEESNETEKVKDSKIINFTKKEDKKYKDIHKKQCVISRYKVLSTMVAMFAIVFSIICYNQVNKYKVSKSVVMIDVNPSISLEIDIYDNVTLAKGINNDGKNVLNDIDIKKMDINKALDKILNSMIEKGFISKEENAILITVNNKDIKEGKRLEEKTASNINKILNKTHTSAKVLTQIYVADNDIEKLAKSYNISEGKARIINDLYNNKILNKEGNLISKEELVKLNINEIHTIINDNDIKLKDVMVEDIINNGTYVDNSNEKNNEISELEQDKSDKNEIDKDELEPKENSDINLVKVNDKNIKVSSEGLDNEKLEGDNVYKSASSSLKNVKVNGLVSKETLKNKKEEVIIVTGVASLENISDDKDKINDTNKDMDFTDNKNNNIDTQNNSLDHIIKNESISEGNKVGNSDLKDVVKDNKESINKEIKEEKLILSSKYYKNNIIVNLKDLMPDKKKLY